MKRKDKVTVRISVGFTRQEWEDIKKAILTCNQTPAAMRVSFEEGVTYADRNWWIRSAVRVVAKAVIRDGCDKYVPLACDLRDETKEERAERLGEPLQQQLDLPDNIVQLFSAEDAGAVA